MKTDWALAQSFLSAHPDEAARLLEDGGPAASAAILARCPAEVVVEALRSMDLSEAARVLTRLPDERASPALSGLPIGSASQLLRLTEATERARLLAALPADVARSLKLALDHPADTAGAMMDLVALALPAGNTVGEARERVRRRPSRVRSYLYIVDDDRRPVGAITLRELMYGSSQVSLASVMRSPVDQVSARARAEAILAHPGWRELHALPVVDDDGVLVGVLRRETFERLRAEVTARGAGLHTGMGVALAEMLWTLTGALVGELAAAVRQRPSASEEKNQ